MKKRARRFSFHRETLRRLCMEETGSVHGAVHDCSTTPTCHPGLCFTNDCSAGCTLPTQACVTNTAVDTTS